MISQESTTTLEEALQAFTTWIEHYQESTQETIRNSAGRYRFGDTLLWANGSMQDNRWLHFAYETCKLIQPVKFIEYKCATTANYTAQNITKQNFRREADRVRRGQRYDTVKDCLHQIGWLVNGLNASMGNQATNIQFLPLRSPLALLSTKDHREDEESITTMNERSRSVSMT